jgi:sulfatase maturation enzyme AslB (radical SAM superfamily)
MRYSLHITNNCNLHCTYCYEDNKIEKDRKSFVVSFMEIDQKLQEILSRGNCNELELLGGEIFLYPDKVKYIFENYHKCFPFILTTNGTIRNAAIDELIALYRPRIGVSLDDPNTVTRQRLGIDLNYVLSNAKSWQKVTDIIIAAVINPLNIRRIKETFDFYILEHGFRSIHFGCVEEWMNDFYWDIYKKEVARLIQNTDISVLQQTGISPWKWYSANNKEIIFEDGIEKIEIFNTEEVCLSQYQQAMHYGHQLYCARVGTTPQPLVPAGVRVVEQKDKVFTIH